MPDPLDALIPHRPPMRWIDALVDCTDTGAVATARFEAGDFPVAGDSLLETALIECVAQTAAAALGRRVQSKAPAPTPDSDANRNTNVNPPAGPGGGMLAAVRDFRIEAPAPVGKELRVEIRQLKKFGPMLLISGSIVCEGRRIASGELTLYV